MINRVAFLSLHTSPLAQPGRADAGGMNVYVDRLARTLARRGLAVDVFTRRVDPAQPEDIVIEPNYRVIHVTAGAEEPLAKAALGEVVREFALGVTKWADAHRAQYQVVHSHYWLSGWAGVIVKERLQAPLAHSFHTLGRLKDATRRRGQPPESLLRIATETEVLDHADCVICSTQREAEDLVSHYGATRSALFISPPGVDHEVFSPADKVEARKRLGIEYGPILLFVGRIQPLKSVDVAIESLAVLADALPTARLVVIGGPSGPDGVAELAHLGALAAQRGVDRRVVFHAPEDHSKLADFYRASDVLIVPSRSESFGLVAVEAQACGLPVVAANVGGLSYSVADAESGILVDGWNPASYAAAVAEILSDEERLESFRRGARAHSQRFSWDGTADRLVALYESMA
jgi:D-inositol-3-phosphate glycosyltransferase